MYDVAVETPVHDMPLMSEQLGNRVLVKREDLQPVFSFKLRGAYNKIARLRDTEKKRGVIAASAGNHAQGVALAASRSGIEATIVMPCTTPDIKVQSVRRLGARVVLHGDNFDQACARARELEKQKGAVFIHPYDDPDVIAGQGTIGIEILRQHTGPLHALFVPVGGGGLIAGIATYVKYLRPEVKIIGVESEDSACLAAARKAGRRVTLPRTGIFVDGLSVSQIGKEPFRLVRNAVDDVIVVSNDAICGAIKDLFEDTRSIAEPAGATALAGLKAYVRRRRFRGRTLMAIESGANVNFDRLRYVSERANLGEQTEVMLAVALPEKPGSLKTFCRTLKKHAITEFKYRYCDHARAQVFVGIRVEPGSPDRRALIRDLRAKGFQIEDMSGNEVAKTHVCNMVGGRPTDVPNEMLFNFEFPERPGALMNFLDAMRRDWNISLFHYRDDGGSYAHVLVGLQIPPEERKLVPSFLLKLNYPCTIENDNTAYRIFLRPRE